MKKILLASAAAIVFAAPGSVEAADLPLKAAPVAMVPQATGYIEVYGGWASTRSDSTETFGGSESDFFSSTFKGGVLGGAGRGNYWVGPHMSIQLDVQAEGTSYDIPLGSVSNASSLNYLIGGHVSWRDPGRYLWGAFAGIGDVSPMAARHAVFGGEGQYYWGNQITFYGQLGYDTTLHRVDVNCSTIGFCVPDNLGTDVNAWFVRGTGRYYVTPNIRLEATGMYANGEMNDPIFEGKNINGDFETLLWEAKAEWKMDHNPFAFFFKYRGSRTDYHRTLITDSTETLNTRITDNRFLVGARMYIGEGTLLWNDRNGTTLDIIDPLAVQSGPLYAGSSVKR